MCLTITSLFCYIVHFNLDRLASDETKSEVEIHPSDEKILVPYIPKIKQGEDIDMTYPTYFFQSLKLEDLEVNYLTKFMNEYKDESPVF